MYTMARQLPLIFVLIGVLDCHVSFSQDRQVVPAGGNSWVIAGSDTLRRDGLLNWSDPTTRCIFYVWAPSGRFRISLSLVSSGASRVSVTALGQVREVSIKPGQTEHDTGEWMATATGYIPVEVQGISRSGSSFGNLTSIALTGFADDSVSFVRTNEGNFFYWGRRGPSVHLRFDLGDRQDIEWFYSEINVPEKNDVIGSYYMANGFSDGYFGFQVNSPSERRILFSVWSPFKTDDPRAIPEKDRILLVRKGEGVYSGEFGNEGSGGQSFLRYNWKAGTTYGFLLRGQPDGTTTVYTAWFFPPEEGRWRLVASWRRPGKSTYLGSLYSFLENFIPETGNLERRAFFGNQWVRNKAGAWTELTRAKFTGDNTARKGYRRDYGGGVSGQSFFLRNCGFFSDFVPLDSPFERASRPTPPKIEFSALP